MFFILMNIIIQGTFNQIMDLSDDVIGWVGSVGKNTAGRGAEDKAHGGFVAVGRSMGQSAKVSLGPKPNSNGTDPNNGNTGRK